MGLFNWKKESVSVVEAPSTAAINKNTYKNFIVKAIGFIASQGSSRGDMVEPEYNLSEIKSASDSDSYIKMALMKYSYMVFKAGYSLKGTNDAAIEYVNMRFRVMSFATGTPMDILFQEVADDMIKYSNSFLIKSRVDKLMPGVNAKGVYNDKPIGGYFRVDPSSMKVKRDKNGAIKGYEQSNDAGTKSFQATEVIHLYMDKDANNAFGTPRIIAALEDVKLLRRIEGNVISLIYRFAIPIYQWMIGMPVVGFQASDKEIQEAQKEIENMPMDGVIVTNEKTQIKAIGAEGQALDASGYLKYFEQRVFSALGVSEAQMGRGGAKQDADSMEAQVHDTVKYVQRTMSIFFENYVINELLLEGGFNPVMNEDDIVNYSFEEISLDTKVKIENHEMLKFQSNLVTMDEARQAIGKKADVDETRLYVNMIENAAAIEQINAKTEGAVAIANGKPATGTAAAKTGVAGNGKTVSAKPSGAAKNANRPTNQHGTGSVSIKSSMDDENIAGVEVNEAIELQEISKAKLNSHKKMFSGVYKKYENLRNDIIDTETDIDMLISVTTASMMSDLKAQIQLKSFDGVERAVQDINKGNASYHLLPNSNISLEQFYEEAETTLKGILTDIKKRIKADRSPMAVKIVFSTLEYRVRFMLEFVMPKVYWYSYVKTGAYYGINKAYIKFDGSDDKDDHPAEINTDRFTIDQIPAYHSFCNCKVSFKAGDK